MAEMRKRTSMSVPEMGRMLGLGGCWPDADNAGQL